MVGRNKNRIHFRLKVQRPLGAIQRHKGIAWQLLSWVQTETSQSFGGYDVNDFQIG